MLGKHVLLKQWYWLVIVNACIACAPIPADKAQQKPSFFEKVLSKKEHTELPTAVVQNPENSQFAAIKKSEKPQSITISPAKDSQSAKAAPDSSDTDMDELAQKLSAPVVESHPSPMPTHQPASNDALAVQEVVVAKSDKPHSFLLFNVNAPDINVVNLTGKPLNKLAAPTTFDNEQLNQTLSAKLDGSPLFQLKSIPTKTSLGSQWLPWDKQKPHQLAQADGDLSIEAKLIINQTEDLQSIGITLNLAVFDGVGGDQIANTRTYQAVSTNENKIVNDLITQAVDDLSAEVSANWLAR